MRQVHNLPKGARRLSQRLSQRSVWCVALAGLLIALAGCGASGASTGGAGSGAPTSAPTAIATSQPTATPSAPANATVIKIIGATGAYKFSPASVTVKVGDTVVWMNETGVAHTATSDSDAALTWDSGAIDVGGMYSLTVTKAGTFAYHCSIHPFMRGTLIVTG